ncbi:MAG: cytochrome c peroxidase [Saprospiraceae bacterium]
MKNFLPGAIAMVLILSACSSDQLTKPLEVELEKAIKRASPTGEFDHFILPDPTDFANIPQDPQNPLTAQKVELGKMLFYETGLALLPKHAEGKGTFSCSSCHVPEAGFMPGRAQGIADGGVGFGQNGEGRVKYIFYNDEEPDVQGVRALNVMNVAFVPNTTWSGKFGGTYNNLGTEDQWVGETEINKLGLLGPETQSIEVFTKVHRFLMNEHIADSLGYKPLFDAAFPEVDQSERYSEIPAAFAMAAYLRTLIANDAPFQQYLKGDETAMTEQEKRGALLFFGQAGCVKCHNGKPLNNPDQFFAIGVKDLYETGQAIKTNVNDKANLGRGGFTGKAEDLYKFKVPQLYNMKETPFFFHGSSKRNMQEVVEYFNKAEPENARVPKDQIAPQFRPLGLSDSEKADLVAFLENALHDHNMHRYVPDQVLSGNCFPNNDLQSQADLGCQ